jgi:hypothetical protein
MAPRDYIWDSQAAKRIEEQGLHKHYKANKDHYDDLAESLWRNLDRISERPGYLKHGDLWDVLHPVLVRDSIMLAEFKKKKLPEPGAYGGAKWIAWFAHYVVEKFLKGREGARGDG